MSTTILLKAGITILATLGVIFLVICTFIGLKILILNLLSKKTGR